MPELHIAVDEISTHIYEPIAKQTIIKTVKDLDVAKHVGQKLYIDFGYSTIKNQNVQSLNSMFKGDKLYCNVSINSNPQSLKWDNYTFLNAPSYGITKNDVPVYDFLFYDSSIPLQIMEHVSPVVFTIEYIFSFVSRSTAYSVAVNIKNRLGDPSIVSTRDLTFDYPLNGLLLNTLHEMHKLQNYPMHFVNYLYLGSKNRISFNTDKNVKNYEPVILKDLTQVLTTFEYSEEKPVEKKTNKLVDYYQLRMTQYIQPTLPNMLTIQYPVVVNNALVPQEYIVINKSEPMPSLQQESNIPAFRKDQERYQHLFPAAIKLPDYDDWIVPSQSPAKVKAYDEIFSSVFLLDEEIDEHGITSLSDTQWIDVLDSDHFDGYEFHPLVDHFLLLQGRESFGFDVLFNISIYRDNDISFSELTDMDHYGNIYVSTKIKKCVYRIVISELTDFRNLNPKWWDELFKWMDDNCKDLTDEQKATCCPYLKIFDDYDRYIKNGGDPNNINGKGNNNDRWMIFRRLSMKLRARRTGWTPADLLTRYSETTTKKV